MAMTRTHRIPQDTLQRRTHGVERRKRWFGWFFVSPFALVFILFLVLPLCYAFWMSLHSKTLIGGAHFSGLANYTRALQDPDFTRGLLRVLQFSVVMIPIQLVLALVIALVLDTLTSRLARASRLMVFVPYAVPAVVGVLIWGFLYSPSFGPVSQVLSWLGVHAPNMLAPNSIFWALTNVVTWQWTGYYMIVLYSSLQSIDPAIYEAARIDGANGRQIAWRIKTPMVSSSLVLITVFAIIGTLQFFTEPTVLKGIAPTSINASYTPNMYAYSLAFSYSQFNYASAISFLLGAIVFIGSYVFLFLTRKKSGLQ